LLSIPIFIGRLDQIHKINTIRHIQLKWHDMTWHDMKWHDMIWYDVIL
jgi:hypothetical protein